LSTILCEILYDFMRNKMKKPVDDLEALEIALVSKCGPVGEVLHYQLVVTLLRGFLCGMFLLFRNAFMFFDTAGWQWLSTLALAGLYSTIERFS
jgi:hypothetical protein